MTQVLTVHPNSTAALKWRKRTWRSSRNLYAESAEARRAGDHARADALRRLASRAVRQDLHCG